MKIIFLALSILISSFTLAHAQERVGDWATYRVIAIREDGHVRSGYETANVIQLDYINNAALIETIYVDDAGLTGTKLLWEPTVDLLTAKEGQLFLDACKSPGVNGVLDTIVVPAGALMACQVGGRSPDDKIWFGAVGFGIIKSYVISHTESGGKPQALYLTKELVSFGP